MAGFSNSQYGRYVAVPDSSGHDRCIQSVCVSPNGLWIASVGDDDSAILWSTQDGTAVHDWKVTDHYGDPSFSPNSRYIALQMRSDTIVLRDAWSNFDIVQEINAYEGATFHQCIWSPAGDVFAILSTSSHDGMFDFDIYRWQEPEDETIDDKHHLKLVFDHRLEPLPRLEGPGTADYGWTTACFLHACHRLLCAHYRQDVEQLRESVLCIWDTKSGTLHKRLLCPGTEVTTVSSSPANPGLVVTGSSDGTTRLWDTEAGTILYTLLDTTSELHFSADGMRILCPSRGYARINTWDMSSGTLIASLQTHDRIRTVSISPDGQHVALAYEDGTVRLWKANDGACVAVYANHGSPVTHFAFSPDGQLLCCGAEDGSVCIRPMPIILASENAGMRDL